MPTTTTTPAKGALTRDEAAEYLGVSKDRIDKAIRAGQLRARKNGRAVRIAPADLDAWFKTWPDA